MIVRLWRILTWTAYPLVPVDHLRPRHRIVGRDGRTRTVRGIWVTHDPYEFAFVVFDGGGHERYPAGTRLRLAPTKGATHECSRGTVRPARP